MDDLTLLNPSTKTVELILEKLDLFIMDWGRIKCKTKKSASLILKHGKLIDFNFTLCGEEIPTIQEQPVKTLGRWYTEDMKDTHTHTHTHTNKGAAKQINEGVDSIDKCGLPGKQLASGSCGACIMTLC